MSLQQEIDNELRRLMVLGSGTLTVTMPEGTLNSSVRKVNPLGVAFESLVWQTDVLKDAETKRLTTIADRLSQKLTYLLEPIRVVEVDGQAGAVQMRSYPPYKREQQTSYYEVLVQRGGAITLLRYEKLPGQPRLQILASVTTEVFHRLAEDLSAATD
jgi:hypothetical protein